MKNQNYLEELTHCAACGAGKENFRPYGRKSGYGVARCARCELVFINPRDNPERIVRQYLDDVTSPISYYLQTAAVDSINFNRTLDEVEKIVPGGKLMDIGCNVGTFLQTAQSRGWKADGIEANKNAAAICEGKGFKVYSGLFDQNLFQSLPEKDYDLAAMNDSIEHFPDPKEALRLASQILKKNGLLSITTPNINNVLAQIFQIKPKEHLFYFNAKSIAKILAETGFKIEALKERGRKRDVGAMHLGATFENRTWFYMSKILDWTKLDVLASAALEAFPEELFVLARKIS